MGNKTILGLALACYGAAVAMLLFGRRPDDNQRHA